MATREARFLNAMRRLVYDNAESPYRRLLEWADCNTVTSSGAWRSAAWTVRSNSSVMPVFTSRSRNSRGCSRLCVLASTSSRMRRISTMPLADFRWLSGRDQRKPRGRRSDHVQLGFSNRAIRQ